MELELDVARQNRTDPRFRPSPRSRVSFFTNRFVTSSEQSDLSLLAWSDCWGRGGKV